MKIMALKAALDVSSNHIERSYLPLSQSVCICQDEMSSNSSFLPRLCCPKDFLHRWAPIFLCSFLKVNLSLPCRVEPLSQDKHRYISSYRQHEQFKSTTKSGHLSSLKAKVKLMKKNKFSTFN